MSQKTAVFISSAVEISNRTLKTEVKYWHDFFGSKVGHHLRQSPLLDLIISCLSSDLKAGTLAYAAGVLVTLPRLLSESTFHTYRKCHRFFFLVGSCGLDHPGPFIFRIRFETINVVGLNKENRQTMLLPTSSYPFCRKCVQEFPNCKKKIWWSIIMHYKTACKRDRPIVKYRTAQTKRQNALCPEWCSAWQLR